MTRAPRAARLPASPRISGLLGRPPPELRRMRLLPTYWLGSTRTWRDGIGGNCASSPGMLESRAAGGAEDADCLGGLRWSRSIRSCNPARPAAMAISPCRVPGR